MSKELDLLADQLADLEANADRGASISDLHKQIWQVHEGFQCDVMRFFPGQEMWRAVSIRHKPSYIGRLSYPPLAYRTKVGRLNAAGSAMFYAATNAATTLCECRATPGERFAIGHWKTTSPTFMNSMGFCQSLRELLPPSRRISSVFIGTSGSTRDRLLKTWQSKVFTAKVDDTKETRYNLSIALTRFALGPITMRGRLPRRLHGLVYPSVASALMSDNIALDTRSADTLIPVGAEFVEILSVDPAVVVGGDSTIRMRTLDICKGVRSDGRLIWSGESTALSVSPFVMN